MHNVSTNPSSSPHLSFVHVANVLAEIQPIPHTPPVIDISRFSSYNKLIAVVSSILALFKSSRSPLEVLVIQEQRLHCPTLYQYLDNLNMVVPLEVKKLVSQLNPIKENGILKCKGRINKSDLNAETYTPYYLPKQSMLLRLLITHIHVMNSHSPVLPILTLLRQNFWVPRSRPLVSLLNRNCVTCRKLRPRAYQVPPPPPLPKERTRYERPFQTVGVDNTGTFTVLMEDGSESQLYITIFVCATTRAVHLEVSPTLTTRDFLLAFRRFCTIYGTPAVVLSDNGRNFVGAEACIAKLIAEEEEVQDHMRKLQIKWKFQTLRTPWKGGHFERLIAVIKSALAAALRRKTLQEEVFRTGLAEAQAVVNNRPLTYLSNQLR